jgi:hypothetical protein
MKHRTGPGWPPRFSFPPLRSIPRDVGPSQEYGYDNTFALNAPNRIRKSDKNCKPEFG